MQKQLRIAGVALQTDVATKFCVRGNSHTIPIPPRLARARGEILVRVVKREHLPTHLLLGVGAAHLARDYSRRQIAEDEAWRQVSISADFGQRYPVDLPKDGPDGSVPKAD